MTGEHLEAILKSVRCKQDKEGWNTLPEGGTMTLYAAFNGAPLTIARVDSIRSDGDILYARTPKRELYALARADVFAFAVDGGASTGQPARRAGFG
jgi:hypothetical protein